MDTFVCENCGKQFPLSNQIKIHWLIRIGVLFSLIFVSPSACCRNCEGAIFLISFLGLLVAFVVIVIISIKLFVAT